MHPALNCVFTRTIGRRLSLLPSGEINGSREPALVIIGEGKHTFPSRTRSLSPRPPMVVRPLLSCESRSSPVLWPAHSERRERAFFLCRIAFRGFTSFLKYGLLLLCFICHTINQFQRESTHFHGQLEEEATLEDEQAQATQAY
jgi:hypothetical protein